MAKTNNSAVLAFDFVINTLLTVIELVAGSLSGSAALLADGFQNLTDSVVITIAYITERLVTGKPLSEATIHRIYLIGGCSNALILIVLAIFVEANAVAQLLNPHPIDAQLVMAVGLLSVVINWLAAGLLASHRRQRAIRAPYIGLLLSGFSGLAVLLSGVAVYFWDWQSVDGLIAALIGLVLLWRASGLLIKAVRGN